MGKKGVDEMINEIEIFLDNCKFQPLSSNKIIVQKDEIGEMIRELKSKIPMEIERCKKIVRNKEAILADARSRSDAIITESVNEANRLVDQHQITELANIRANEILDMARNQAQQIVDQAADEANEIRLGAMYYTKDKLTNMRENVGRMLEAERENYRNLVESLENNLFVVETNMSEMEANINLLTGNNQANYVNQANNDSAFDTTLVANNFQQEEIDVYGERSQYVANQKDDDDDLLDDDDFDDDDFLDD